MNNYYLLAIGIAILIISIKLFKTDKDIVNKPTIKDKSKTTGSNSLFDQILNDDFQDED